MIYVCVCVCVCVCISIAVSPGKAVIVYISNYISISVCPSLFPSVILVLQEDLFVPFPMRTVRSQAGSTCITKPFPIPASKSEIQQTSVSRWTRDAPRFCFVGLFGETVCVCVCVNGYGPTVLLGTGACTFLFAIIVTYQASDSQIPGVKFTVAATECCFRRLSSHFNLTCVCVCVWHRDETTKSQVCES